MKLKEFLKQFEGLDPELEIIKQERIEDWWGLKNFTVFNYQYTDDLNDDLINFSSYSSDKYNTKIILLT